MQQRVLGVRYVSAYEIHQGSVDIGFSGNLVPITCRRQGRYGLGSGKNQSWQQMSTCMVTSRDWGHGNIGHRDCQNCPVDSIFGCYVQIRNASGRLRIWLCSIPRKRPPECGAVLVYCRQLRTFNTRRGDSGESHQWWIISTRNSRKTKKHFH